MYVHKLGMHLSYIPQGELALIPTDEIFTTHDNSRQGEYNVQYICTGIIMYVHVYAPQQV